ncbi:MAG: ribosome small subunit-dependent GTPase A [Desulfobacteraceae bacterium]|nr:ribosome small subunit-dependent GTPase A [Desulfobacteraceae bacterium]MDH3836534.1 ribosome small subunit-dependent GTPase A [Desulfobacteraceae bacterium]MDH3875901.1 ribosome small subunit-dependent GTPase A [Desulfobacteraceae bacterium]
MKNVSMKIEQLGFNKWFFDEIDPTKFIDHQIARVITVNKDSYTIDNGKGEVSAEVTGKLLFSADSPLDYPATGDWVFAKYFDNDSFAIISEIVPRKSILKRKTSGKKIEFQLIATNIDTGLIVQSLDNNYNLRRLERYLVMIIQSNIQPVVLLSKSDLLPVGEIDKKVDEIHALYPDIRVLPFSNEDNTNLKHVKELLVPKKTYCLLGSSGVGKTTLINNLLDGMRLKTHSVREKDGKGRHITTRRQLIKLKNGAMIIDTPGMRELGNFAVDTGIYGTFDEITELSNQCRYNDCSHTQEQGCSILAALKDGIISQERYQNFIKLNKESAFYEMSYLEKKRKDKKFGKFVKSVLKEKKYRK